MKETQEIQFIVKKMAREHVAPVVVTGAPLKKRIILERFPCKQNSVTIAVLEKLLNMGQDDKSIWITLEKSIDYVMLLVREIVFA